MVKNVLGSARKRVVRGCKQTKCPFLKKISPKAAPMPLISRIGPAWNKNFSSNLLFQGNIEIDYLPKNVTNLSFWSA